MKRYEHLVKIIEKGLSESSKCIDTKLAIQQCYGDDISMFASSSSDNDGVEMLSNLIKNILENINESFLQNELPSILSKNNVQLKLDILDQVILHFISKEREEQERELRDIQSARDAVDDVQEELQMDLSQIMMFYSYQMKKKVRDELMADLDREKNKRDNLLQEVERQRDNVKKFVDAVEENIVDPLNRNADICSFHQIK